MGSMRSVGLPILGSVVFTYIIIYILYMGSMRSVGLSILFSVVFTYIIIYILIL